MRLHGSLLSLVGGTPTFAISYFTAKTDGVMDTIGMGDQVAAYESVDGDEVVARVRALVCPAARDEARAAAARSHRELEELGTL